MQMLLYCCSDGVSKIYFYLDLKISARVAGKGPAVELVSPSPCTSTIPSPVSAVGLRTPDSRICLRRMASSAAASRRSGFQLHFAFQNSTSTYLLTSSFLLCLRRNPSWQFGGLAEVWKIYSARKDLQIFSHG